MTELKRLKNNNGFRKRCAAIGTLFLVAVLLLTTQLPALPVLADKTTEERIKEREQQVTNSKQERDQLEANVSNLQRMKEELEQEKADLDAYITRLDGDLTSIQANIEILKGKIEDKIEEIRVTTEELEEAQRVQDEQYAAMKERVRFMYERGNTMALEAILGIANFGDSLNKARYIEKLSEYDRNKLDEYIATTNYVALTKELLEEEKQTLDDAEKKLEEEEEKLEKLIAEKMAQLLGLNADISNKEELIAAYESSIAQTNAEIAALEQAIAADRARLAAENRRRYDGGMFTWPCPSTYTITSDYGYRTHPIFGDTRFHSGIDIGGGYGATIVAAYAGTVVASSYNASMGNYIMIDHGDSLYTIYMHCSALYVSTGTSVNAGDSIGAVGSTGNSTGPHLHFSVRINGAYASPWSYLG